MSDNRHAILPGQLPGRAQHALFSTIVLIPVKPKPLAFDFPTGEAAGKLANVGLGVVPLSEAEQLHDLPRIVFVGVGLPVAR